MTRSKTRLGGEGSVTAGGPGPRPVRCTVVQLYPGDGGPTRSLGALAEAVNGAVRLSVIAGRGTPAARFLGAMQVDLHTVDPGALTLHPRGLLDLRRTLRSVAPNGVVIANTVGALLPLLLTASRRVVLGVHLRNSAYSRSERALLRITPYLRRDLFAMASSTFALDLVADTAAIYGRITHLIPNPVMVPPPVVADRDATRLRVAVATSADSLVKGIDVLAGIIAAVDEPGFEWPEVEWVVFGVEDDKVASVPRIAAALASVRADPRVRMAGRTELAEALPTIDVVLVTSWRESFSRVAAEAMAAGVPVVAPRHTALPTTLAGGRAGLLYEPGDVGDARRMLARVLGSARLRAELGAAGRAHVTANFAPDVVADRFSAVLDDVWDATADRRRGRRRWR